MSVVAREVGTSERSLLRELQQEGTSFQQLVGEVRLEGARAISGRRRGRRARR